MAECGGNAAKPSTSQLVIKAITVLQRKNGTTSGEITEFVAKKRCVPPCSIEDDVNFALEKATQQGIFAAKKGSYRIAALYDDKLKNGN